MEQWGPCRDWQIREGDRQRWDGDGAVRATRGVAGQKGDRLRRGVVLAGVARCGAGVRCWAAQCWGV